MAIVAGRDAHSGRSAVHAQFIEQLAQLPLEEIRQGSATEALYGRDVEEFLHPQSQANEMDCD